MTDEGFNLLDFYEQMKDQGSDAFTFLIERQPEPGKTISHEALHELEQVFRAFVSARLAARLESNPEGHSKVAIDLRVTINDESTMVDDSVAPWYHLTDGEHRKRGLD